MSELADIEARLGEWSVVEPAEPTELEEVDWPVGQIDAALFSKRLLASGRLAWHSQQIAESTKALHQALAEISRVMSTPGAASSSAEKLERRFKELSERWKSETELESSIARMALNSNYQQIIGLGSAAVPLLLEELENEPNYWFWALTSITGEDPAEGEETLEGARDRWLEWGRENGLLV